MTEAKSKPGLFPVRLMKNYSPLPGYEVIGHCKPAVMAKNAAGQMVEIEKGGFIEGEVMPPPFAGAGFAEARDKSGKATVGPKIWAGTVLGLPVDEAKRLIALKIAERADALPG